MALLADARIFILLQAHKTPEKSKDRVDWWEKTALIFLSLSPPHQLLIFLTTHQIKNKCTVYKIIVLLTENKTRFGSTVFAKGSWFPMIFIVNETPPCC